LKGVKTGGTYIVDRVGARKETVVLIEMCLSVSHTHTYTHAHIFPVQTVARHPDVNNKF